MGWSAPRCDHPGRHTESLCLTPRRGGFFGSPLGLPHLYDGKCHCAGHGQFSREQRVLRELRLSARAGGQGHGGKSRALRSGGCLHRRLRGLAKSRCQSRQSTPPQADSLRGCAALRFEDGRCGEGRSRFSAGPPLGRDGDRRASGNSQWTCGRVTRRAPFRPLATWPREAPDPCGRRDSRPGGEGLAARESERIDARRLSRSCADQGT